MFSLTLQASIIHICKESKVFKNQQSPITEEEEKKETNDGDESPDEEVLYLNQHHFSFSSLGTGHFISNSSVFNFPFYYFKIPIPPPKY